MTAIRLPRAPLSDGVVTLRTWRPEDIERLAALSRDPEIPRFTRVPEGNTAEHVRMFAAQHAIALTAGRFAAFAICAAPDGPAEGVIDLRVDWEHERASIGYWLGAPARGRGWMTRAVRLIAGWGLEGLGLARIEIHVATDNPRSQAVAERAGFVREGVLRSYQQLKGRRQDVVVFSRLRGDA